MKQKAIFFLRHYNDIDHIVPVIYKWCTVEEIPIDIVISGHRDMLTDYRIQFLRQFKNLHIAFIDDVFPQNDEESIQHKLDIIFGDVENGIIVFDWIMTTSFNKMIEAVVKWAQKRKLPTISLPHGDNPQHNKMLFVNEINYDSTDIYWSGGIFDYVVVPNELCARRYKPHMDSERIKIFGSPRFNNEWLGILKNLAPKYINDKAEKKLKVLFFLFHKNFSGFWDEVINTIKLVTQFPDIYLIVVGHTRGKLSKHPLYYYDLDEYITHIPNMELAPESYPSTSLLNWADVVMDMGTSIVFEAVKLNKPVLSMEYLHATHSTIAHYMKNCIMHCRDLLYDTIIEFMKNPDHHTYNEIERKRFINAIIEVNGLNVLDQYTSFLQNCIRKKNALNNDQIRQKNYMLNKLIKYSPPPINQNNMLKVEVLSRELDKKEKKIRQKEEKIRQLEHNIKRMENTLSWRLTKPLRSKFINRLLKFC